MDSRGRLVPESTIKEVDRLRDDLVGEIVAKAKAASEHLAGIKAKMLSDVDAFVSLSAEQYGVYLGGGKGNVTLRSFDGNYMVTISVDEHLRFDERLKAAQELINEFFDEELAGSSENVCLIVKKAFDVDRNGNIATKRVLGLRQMAIRHPKWQQAMAIISDSVHVVDSKRYIRVYKRGSDDKFNLINLDIASI
jgi:hypothetical protein